MTYDPLKRLKEEYGSELSKKETDFLELFCAFCRYDRNYTTDILSIYRHSLLCLNHLKEEKNMDVSKLLSVNIKQLLGEIMLLSSLDIIEGTNYFEEFHHGHEYVHQRLNRERCMEIVRTRKFDFSDIRTGKELMSVSSLFDETDIKMVKKSKLNKFDNLMLKYIEMSVKQTPKMVSEPSRICLTANEMIANDKKHFELLKRYPRKTLVGEMIIISGLRKVNIFEELRIKGYEYVEDILISEKQEEDNFKYSSHKQRLSQPTLPLIDEK